MLAITPTLGLPEEELHLTFSRAGGPGGQNVNKVSSKALLRWNPQASALPPDVKARLLEAVRNRLTKDGDLLLSCQRFRDQARNVEDCRERLRDLILEALHPPKVRRPTKPTRGSRLRRRQAKRHRSRLKAARREPGGE
jgi:ribosome-associated protein